MQELGIDTVSGLVRFAVRFGQIPPCTRDPFAFARRQAIPYANCLTFCSLHRGIESAPARARRLLPADGLGPIPWTAHDAQEPLMTTTLRNGAMRLLASAALLLAAPAALADYTVRCGSEHHRRHVCALYDPGVVTLERKISGASCTEGRSWGYDDRSIWVDDGCEADFRVQTSARRHEYGEPSGTPPEIIMGSNREGEVIFKNNCVVYYDAQGRRTNKLSACSSGQVRRADEAMAAHRREQGIGGDYADGLAGGADFWRVQGVSGHVSGNRLPVHVAPARSSNLVISLQEGEVVRNRGCEMHGGERWCRVEPRDDSRRSGWVLGQYLREY